MIKLFLQPNDIATLTGFSGNIDVDNLKACTNIAQTMQLKRILGNDLYNYLWDNINSLTGDYETIYNDYVVYMTAFFSASVYLSLMSSKVSNLGTVRMNAENSTSTPYSESNILSKNYESIAIAYEKNFYEFMKTISIPEYGSSEQNKPLTNYINWN